MLVPSGNVALASAPASSNAFVAVDGAALARRTPSAVNSPVASRASRSAPALISAAIAGAVVLGGRQHQRGLPAAALRRVDVGAGREQSLDRRDVARACGRHQQRLALGEHRVADRRRPRAARASSRHRRSPRRDTRDARRSDSRASTAAPAASSADTRLDGRRGARPNAAPTCRRHRPRSDRPVVKTLRSSSACRSWRPRAASVRPPQRRRDGAEQRHQREARLAHLDSAVTQARRVPCCRRASRRGTSTPIEQRQQQIRHRRVRSARLGADRRRAARPARRRPSSGKSKCACKFGLPNAPPYRNSE